MHIQYIDLKVYIFLRLISLCVKYLPCLADKNIACENVQPCTW